MVQSWHGLFELAGLSRLQVHALEEKPPPEISNLTHLPLLETEFAFSYQGQLLAQFTLPAGEYVIGREPDCEVAIDIDGIAPRHARLLIGERLTLEDLGSELGVFVEGERFRRSVELGTGASVQLGSGGTLRVERRHGTAMLAAVEQDALGPADGAEAGTPPTVHEPLALEPNKGGLPERPPETEVPAVAAVEESGPAPPAEVPLSEVHPSVEAHPAAPNVAAQAAILGAPASLPASLLPAMPVVVVEDIIGPAEGAEGETPPTVLEPSAVEPSEGGPEQPPETESSERAPPQPSIAAQEVKVSNGIADRPEFLRLTETLADERDAELYRLRRSFVEEMNRRMSAEKRFAALARRAPQ